MRHHNSTVTTPCHIRSFNVTWLGDSASVMHHAMKVEVDLTLINSITLNNVFNSLADLRVGYSHL